MSIDFALTEIGGTFVKIAFEQDVPILLNRNSPSRPAARYNRIGENALYLSVDEASARIAMKKYVRASDPPRVLIRYKIDPCQVSDIRSANDHIRKLVSQDWQAEQRMGKPPGSWTVADALRRANISGLIDPSRKNPQLWHLTMLNWNTPEAPAINMIGEPQPIELA